MTIRRAVLCTDAQILLVDVLCHSIRGTDAHGLVGPDLTHLASRKGLAANAFPNSTAYLAWWVTYMGHHVMAAANKTAAGP